MGKIVLIETPEQMEDVGRAVAAQARIAAPAEQASVILLDGELGAGKTTMVRGCLRALGVTGSVKSPTYTIVEPYTRLPCGLQVYHLDLYRLTSADELEAVGYRDMLTANTVLWVEWANRIDGLVSRADLWIEIAIVGSRRELAINAISERGAHLAGALL